ncbi:hypothetical protein ZTR_09849 [Talaromyces verruculosus]|nr:hypothetical protein ZTR_09849 [Talaromyces verruculosus]
MSGLEAVGVVSSIVQIADLGARVALKLCTVYQKVQQTESDLQNLSKDVSRTCAILQQFGKDLERDDQIQLYSQKVFKRAQEVLDECRQVFREIESVMDKDLSTIAFTTAASPFLRLSRKAAILLKRPRLDILQRHLDRLKNTVLLIINVIIYASQQRKREIESPNADQQECIEILMKRIRESDQKFERLTRAIKGADPGGSLKFVENPVTINTVGIFGFLLNCSRKLRYSLVSPAMQVTISGSISNTVIGDSMSDSGATSSHSIASTAMSSMNRFKATCIQVSVARV